ncbi:hypothetical protein [Scytonema sp. NUACC26]|uniref:hypothetical protein n=1 Tax=Scytonema sp. NUACC26 TaxID=3140176 RepID=UPI0038B33C67
MRTGEDAHATAHATAHPTAHATAHPTAHPTVHPRRWMICFSEILYTMKKYELLNFYCRASVHGLERNIW